MLLAADIYVTFSVVGSALLAYALIKCHQHVLKAQSGALQYTKLGADSARPAAGTALQPILCESRSKQPSLPTQDAG